MHPSTILRPHLRLHRMGVISYNSRSQLMFLQSKVNSARYITQVVNLVSLSFIRQEGDELFSAGQRASIYGCCDATCSSWCTTAALARKIPRSLAIWTLRDLMKRELILSPEPARTIAEFGQRVQDAWDHLSQDDIRHLYDHLYARIHACVAASGVLHNVLMLLFGHPLLWRVSFGLNLSYTPTMINYLSLLFSM